MTQKFEIYLDDLTQECQERLSKLISYRNDNYDVFPLAILEFEVNENIND